jgi:regulator of replication initiation timing
MSYSVYITYVIRFTICLFNQFSKTQKQIEKTVKQELGEILEDAERLKIDREEIRRMLREAFNIRRPHARTDFRIVLAKIIAR